MLAFHIRRCQCSPEGGPLDKTRKKEYNNIRKIGDSPETKIKTKSNK